jgi:hypothetical protein
MEPIQLFLKNVKLGGETKPPEHGALSTPGAGCRGTGLPGFGGGFRPRGGGNHGG